MITAVDTNILIDVLEPDPAFGPASRDALKRCLLEGSVVACEIVWAEVAVAYGHAVERVVKAMDRMGIEYSAMASEATLEAARCWYDYLKKGGDRRRIAADFLIGGHASKQADRLLTRDKGFYRSYFKKLDVEAP
ncbi:MAG: type II toxin-antitoxin system VapC family toxin [Deltaproteobacteria bacterium]|nr:type II toxin-antitoxin system VapC family toxin [Deltaproteobacteria bacterium]